MRGHDYVITPKQLEINGCILSTVADDALAPKHQAISNHSGDTYSCIGHVSLHSERHLKMKFQTWKNDPDV